MMKPAPDARRTALITGASSGIGLELARLLAADGVDLVLVARSQPRLDQLAQILRGEHGISVQCKPTDLAEPLAALRLWDVLAGSGIVVDILVNNAGSGLYGRLEQLDEAALRNMLQLNVVALTALTRLALPGMQSRGFGQILNVGSVVGYQPAG